MAETRGQLKRRLGMERVVRDNQPLTISCEQLIITASEAHEKLQHEWLLVTEVENGLSVEYRVCTAQRAEQIVIRRLSEYLQPLPSGDSDN